MEQIKEINYIVVEGVIGVGKTTFAKKLASDINAKLILEEIDHHILENFYKNMERNALQTQLYFLLNRINQQKEIKQLELFQRKIVSDYLMEKDKIFAYINLSEDELKIYEKIYSIIVDEKQILKPDLIVFLQAKIDILYERIKKRGRDFEKNIPYEYIAKLSEAYNYFFAHLPREIPLVIIKTDEFDIYKDESAFQNIKEFILSIKKSGIHYYIPSKE